MKNCPAGQQYNAARSRCQEIMTQPPPPPSPIPGTVSNDCPSGKTWHKQRRRCLTPAEIRAL